MKFQVNDGEKFQKVMEVEIPAAEMEQYIRIGCKKLADKVNIPGFRKGKAPRSILENYLGTQAILEEAADAAIPPAYAQGLRETGIEPVAQPQIDITQLEEGKDMIFKATVIVKPVLTLGEYKGIDVDRRIIDVSEADIDEEINKQQHRMAKLVEGEEGDKAAKGDTVVIDFKGILDGEAFEGGTGHDYPLELGSGTFIPGFEDQLIGIAVGEQRNLDITFPEDYGAKELAGKAVVFEVTAKGLKHKVLPELDDEFVQEVSETASNMEEYRAEVKDRLNQETERLANEAAISNAVAKAMENCQVELPPVMIEYEMDHLVADNKRQMEASGISVEEYMEYTKQTPEQFRLQFKQQAEYGIKKELMLEEIIKAENIEVPQEAVDNHIAEMAARYWMTEEQLREMLAVGSRMEDFIYDMKRKKAAEFIFENAHVIDEHISKEELKRRADEQAKERAAEAEKLMHQDCECHDPNCSCHDHEDKDAE